MGGCTAKLGKYLASEALASGDWLQNDLYHTN